MKQSGLQNIFILIALVGGLGFGFCTAQDNQSQDKGDCNFVTNTKGKDLGLLVESRSGQNELIYPKESIKRAILNLKAYCCQKGGILLSDSDNCKYDQENGRLSTNHPDSKFLYDHLVDIGFRRLDAKENLLYKGVEPDPVGKQRRDFINKKGSQVEGTTPTDILATFYGQRTFHIDYSLPQWEDGNYNEQYLDAWTGITVEYGNWPLINRYSNVCEIASYVYGHLKLGLGYYTRTNGYPKCKLLTKNIINRNIVFTKSIVLQKSDKLLYDNMNSHITHYLSQNRLMKLKDTILGIVQAFNVINKKVIQLVKECS